MPILRACLRLGLALSSLSLLPASALADMDVHGSGTVGRGIILPNEEAIEAATGLSLNIVVNGSGNGLQDLAAGRADMAMISAPISAEADIVNAASAGALDISGMEVFEIGTAEILFVVHPNSPASGISEDQMLAILTGEIDNWAAVGGPDVPINLVVEVPGNGTRAVVQSVFMDGADFADGARVVRDLNQVVTVVGQLPNAVGYGNASSIVESSVAVVEGVTVAQPLALVTNGPPTPDMQALIEVVQGLD